MKAKFKIMDLAAKPIERELIHPVHGETGIIVKLVGPHSQQFRDLQKRLAEAKEVTTETNYEVIASLIVGWDEEAFEMPCTPENVRDYIFAPENQWVSNFLSEFITDQFQFFRT